MDKTSAAAKTTWDDLLVDPSSTPCEGDRAFAPATAALKELAAKVVSPAEQAVTDTPAPKKAASARKAPKQAEMASVPPDERPKGRPKMAAADKKDVLLQSRVKASFIDLVEQVTAREVERRAQMLNVDREAIVLKPSQLVREIIETEVKRRAREYGLLAA
ncbi:hypothetical protein DS843_22700 [Roseomonas genomospecies 6]|uniref:Uncharacterized protein n=2 Tax=Roseomonas genomospecies 6 TaxID=214106 RepID=A0A9W7KQQ5_9PROT|nr:hypothetical protein DS843_22700 [Roseomonas genomospecies 6]